MPNTDRLARLGYRTYSEYLRSRHWRSVKARYRRSKLPKRCRLCGDPNYELHHRSYARLGGERLQDLLPLCRDCHQATHDFMVAHDVSLYRAAQKLKSWRGKSPRAKRQSQDARQRRALSRLADSTTDAAVLERETTRILGYG